MNQTTNDTTDVTAVFKAGGRHASAMVTLSQGVQSTLAGIAARRERAKASHEGDELVALLAQCDSDESFVQDLNAEVVGRIVADFERHESN